MLTVEQKHPIFALLLPEPVVLARVLCAWVGPVEARPKATGGFEQGWAAKHTPI